MQKFRSKQHVFDHVTKHLLKQNAKSVVSGKLFDCAYRGDNGTMCAVGCLIPDELYSPTFENLLCGHPEVEERLKMVIETYDQSFGKLLAELQEVHDNCEVSDWLQQLKFVANRNRLRWNF